MTLYKYSLLNPIRAFPSEGRTTWVRRYCNAMRTVLAVPPGTHKLTSTHSKANQPRDALNEDSSKHRYFKGDDW
jgi:hypothetical protein